MIFICENNGFAVLNETSKMLAAESVTRLAESYGVECAVVDGNNVLDVASKTKEAVDRARHGHGPSVIDARTYRMSVHAHFAGAAPERRPQEALAAWSARDPIASFREYLIPRGFLSEEEDHTIVNAVSNDVENAIQYARDCPVPDPALALSGVFVDEQVTL